MANRAALVILALFALFSSPAYAGFALAKPPAGWVKSQAGATFKAPHTFPGNDGYFRTTATVNVGGRVVDLPAGLMVAANAASFVAPALRLTPGGLLGAATLTFLATYGLQWAGSQWMHQQQPEENMGGVWWKSPWGPANCTGTGISACVQSTAEMSAQVMEAWPHLAPFLAPWFDGVLWKVCPESDPDFCAVYAETTIETPPGYVAPATEQDWQQVTGQLPIAVQQDLARLMPLPVALPEALPQRVPLDSPQPVPGTNPQRYKQQVVDIVPRPTLAEPWRVELKPGELESEDPDMPIDPSELGEESPEADPTAGEDPKPGLCEEYPDILACQKLGEVEEQALEEKTVSLSIEATSGWGEGGGSCPADRSVSVLGTEVSMKWTLFCDFADQVRPVVIAMAWLSAVLGFVGLSRREA